MRRHHLYKLFWAGVLTVGMWGCAPSGQDADQSGGPSPEPSLEVPAGMVEVSRMEGYTSAQKADAAAKAETAPQTEGSDKTGKTDRKPEKAAQTAKGPDAVSVSGGFGDQTMESTAITARGENPWTLDAKKVQYDENSKRVRVSSIVWSLLDKEDRPRVTVTGRAADVNIESQNVVFDGPVEAVGSEGETLKVNHLVWDSAKQKILGSHGVRVIRRGTVMTGDNLVSSPDLKQVEITGNVRVTFVDPEALAER